MITSAAFRSSSLVHVLSTMTGTSQSPSPRIDFIPLPIYAENLYLFKCQASPETYKRALYRWVAGTADVPDLVRYDQRSRTNPPLPQEAVWVLYAPNIAYKDSLSQRRNVLVLFAADTTHDHITDHTRLGYFQRVGAPALFLRDKVRGFYQTDLRPRLDQAVRDGELVAEEVMGRHHRYYYSAYSVARGSIFGPSSESGLAE